MTTVGIERKLRGQACSQGFSLEVWRLEPPPLPTSREKPWEEAAKGPILTITGKS